MAAAIVPGSASVYRFDTELGLTNEEVSASCLALQTSSVSLVRSSNNKSLVFFIDVVGPDSKYNLYITKLIEIKFRQI